MGETAEDAYFERALEIVREAGTQLVEAFHKQRDAMDVATKTKSEDLVTEVDKRVEKLIIDKLMFHFPTHEYIGEEATSESGSCKVDWDPDTPTWIIDPIDGTTNFVHRMPLVTICVALTIQHEIVIGIVYNPVSGDLYTARKKKGAFKNGFQLKTSHTKDLTRALLMSSGGKHIASSIGTKKVASIYTANISALYDAKAHGLRWLDCPSLSICLVAEGAADIFFDFGLYCWNMAAPALILTEAGGVLADLKPAAPFQLMNRRVLAAASPDLITAFTALPIQLISFPTQLNS